MSQLIHIIGFVCVLGFGIAQPVVSKRNGFARQEVLPNAAPTGYPAAGFTPDVPFELPSETTLKPDTTYLPPSDETTDFEAQEPVLVYGAPQNNPQEPVIIYGPPQVQNDIPLGTEDDAVEAVVAVSGTFDQQPESQSERLRSRPAKLQLIRGKPENYVYTQTFQRF